MTSISIESIGDTLTVKAAHDLREFESSRIDSEGEDVVRMLDDSGIRNVVIDLSGTDYYGSSALNWFLRLDKKAQAKGGRLVLVGLSDHQKEILQVTKLDDRWTVCQDLAEALSTCKQPRGTEHA